MLAASTAMCMAASAACTRNEPPPALRPSRDAGSWGTLVLASADAIPVAPPPKTGSAAVRSELRELEAAAERRTDAAQARVRRWSARPIVGPWVEAAMASAAEHNFTPPRASRAYGLVTIAMYDAVVSAWHWKYVYDRKPPPEADRSTSGPDPSYPSEHAAAAGAASAVLAALFPQSRFDEAGREAAASRITAGANYPSDVEAGLELGRSVAREVLARAAGDEGKRWDGNRPPGPVFWEPPPESEGGSEPLDPAAGEWHTWVVKPSEARSEFPPRIDSPEFLLSAHQLIDATGRLTARQKKSARFWSAGEGTARVAGMWNRIALDHLSRERAMGTPAAARILAMMNLAQADAGVAAWKTKYTYWSPRPYNAIRDIGLDRDWTPLLRTPLSPSYVSAHAASSGAASSVLAALLPRQQTRFRHLALEAAGSRLFGGVSFSTDTSEGLRVGRLVGRRVLSHAATTGVIKKG